MHLNTPSLSALSIFRFLAVSTVVLAAAFAGPVTDGHAQEAGQKETEKKKDPIPSILFPEPPREPSDDMRALITDISTYVRNKPGFMVLVENGLSLLARLDEKDEQVMVPIPEFIKTIDGVIEEGLFYRRGVPRNKNWQARLEATAKIALDNRLALFTVEYPEAGDVATALQRNRAFGALPMIAPNARLDRLPTQPSRPLGENGNSIGNLRAVKNFAVLRDSREFGTQADFASQMRANNYDLLVMDIYHNGQPLGPQAIETLKFKQLGARRLIFATVDIGHAEPGRFYWKDDWGTGNPPFVKEKPGNEVARHYVEYWRSAWQQIITGNRQSYVHGLVMQGFDGIVIRGVDAYKVFDGTLEDEEENLH